MRRRRGIMGLNGEADIPVIAATATGNPLTFETDMVKPLKSLVIPFTPIQAAGTPSPDNPLPISGWAGCEITQMGKNLCVLDDAHKVSITGTHTISDGVLSIAANTQRVVIIVSVKPNTSYTFGINRNTAGTNTVLSINDYSDIPSGSINNNKISTLYTVTYGSDRTRSGVVTTSANAKYIGFALEKPSGASAAKFDKFYLNVGTQTGYETPQTPYNLQITFTGPTTGDPITVYGGTVTLNEDGSADVVDSRIIVTYDGDEDWGKSGAYYYVRTSSSYNVQQVPVSNLFLGVSNRRFQDLADLEFAMTQNDMSYINIRYDAMTSLDAFKELLSSTPMIVAYERKYPITYHFDDVGQLITFVGTNTIWTDTNGTNTATYLKHQS